MSPVRTYRRIRWPVLVLGTAGTAAALAWGFLAVKHGARMEAFVASFLAWGSYVTAHWAVTGDLVHRGEGQKRLPTDRAEAAQALSGAMLFLAGIGYGAIGVGQDAYWQAFGGALLFLAGYMVTHRAVTGDLL